MRRGITNARGTFDRIELDDTTQDLNFLGFTAAGLKAINEIEVSNSYVHDNQGNGLWCDEFCHDSASHPNGFWIHDNLVVNNGRSGIRFERVGDVSTAGEALIEHNAVHGNSTGTARGGVRIHDAENALVRNNVFGAMTVAGVSYPTNRNQLAVSAKDSGRAARPDLRNVDIVDNILNGETIEGCELPDTVVACSGHTPETTVDSGPTGAVNSTSASLRFSSSEAGSAFECSLDAAPFAECASPKEYVDLIDGEHTFEVKATNARGSDPTPAKHTWSVDTVSPEAPDITYPEDNSHNNTGGVTLSGTAEPGSTVEIFEDTVSKGATLAGAGGTWSVALSSVPNGSHAYTSTATDDAFNTSPPSNTRTVIVEVEPGAGDTVAPRVISTVPRQTHGRFPYGQRHGHLLGGGVGLLHKRTTFKLFKKGSATRLPAAISYSTITDTATLGPDRLPAGGRYLPGSNHDGGKGLRATPSTRTPPRPGCSKRRGSSR
jgi:hypothetical protein